MTEKVTFDYSLQLKEVEEKYQDQIKILKAQINEGFERENELNEHIKDLRQVEAVLKNHLNRHIALTNIMDAAIHALK